MPAALAVAALSCALSVRTLAATHEETKPVSQGIRQASPEGRYRRSRPSRADLVIKPEGANWRVEIVAAGIPRGAGTAADCASVGVGPQVGDRINAQLVPFSIEDIGEVNTEDLEGRTNRLDVRLAKAAVEVVASDGERFCGLGSDLTGVYRKVR
jgi:hypothetical protein